MKKISYISLLIIALTLVLSGCKVESLPQEESNISNLHKATFSIEEMTCTSCAIGIEYQWNELEGVFSAYVSYGDGTGVVVYDADKVSIDTIVQASTVYPAKIIEDISLN